MCIRDSRNTGYSENLFSHSPKVENNTFNSIDGANALKLDETYQIKEEETNSLNDLENENLTRIVESEENKLNNIPSGVSIESASYIESNLDENESIPNILEEKED